MKQPSGRYAERYCKDAGHDSEQLSHNKLPQYNSHTNITQRCLDNLLRNAALTFMRCCGACYGSARLNGSTNFDYKIKLIILLQIIVNRTSLAPSYFLLLLLPGSVSGLIPKDDDAMGARYFTWLTSNCCSSSTCNMYVLVIG